MDTGDVDAMRVELVDLVLAMLSFDPERNKDERGEWKPLSEWSREDAYCISSVTITTAPDGSTKLKLKFVSRKKAVSLAKQLLKAGPPSRDPELLKRYARISDLLTANT